MNTFTSDGDTIYEVRVLVQDTELFSDTICFLLTNTELLMSDTETFAAEIYHLQSVVDALQKELKKRNYIEIYRLSSSRQSLPKNEDSAH